MLSQRSPAFALQQNQKAPVALGDRGF